MKLGKCKECSAVVDDNCQLPEPYQNIYECENCGHPHTLNELAPLYPLQNAILVNRKDIVNNYIMLLIAEGIWFDENEDVDALLIEYTALVKEVYTKTDVGITYDHIVSAISVALDNQDPITFELIQESAIENYVNENL